MPKIIVKTPQNVQIQELEVSSEKPLLWQLEAQWVEIANACKMWMCGACMCYIDDDMRAIKNLRWEPSFPLWEWEIMTCIWGVSEGENIILHTMT